MSRIGRDYNAFTTGFLTARAAIPPVSDSTMLAQVSVAVMEYKTGP